MGAQGSDVQLSSQATELFPYQVECKAHAKFAIYTMYDQALSHGSNEPLLVIKGNHKRPLVVVDAEHFFHLTSIMERTIRENQ